MHTYLNVSILVSFVSSGNAGKTSLSFSSAELSICILFLSLSFALALLSFLSLWVSVGDLFATLEVLERLKPRPEPRREKEEVPKFVVDEGWESLKEKNKQAIKSKFRSVRSGCG